MVADRISALVAGSRALLEECPLLASRRPWVCSAGHIHHHVKLAGRADTLFTDDAIELIHNTSRGLPRAVNNLAVQALLAAYADRKAIVDPASTRIAVHEITAD